MNEYFRELEDARIRKELRFQVDDPKCATCCETDIGTLCKPSKHRTAVLCRNCKDRSKTLTARSAITKLQLFKEAGYSKPACAVCGEDSIQLLEGDHVENDANSQLQVPLCLNHHAIKSQSAEVGPMAKLRLRDPNRRALELQAAFEFGAAAILGMIAVWDGANEQTVRAIFFGVISAGLLLWALWNLQADAQFASTYGADYGSMLPTAPILTLPAPNASAS
jgi:hypothetical protein